MVPGPREKWAVIPSSYHDMKLLIVHELESIPLPTSGRRFTNCNVVCFVLFACCDSKQEAGDGALVGFNVAIELIELV